MAFNPSIISHLNAYLAEDSEASYTEAEINNIGVAEEFFKQYYGTTKGSIKIRGETDYNESEAVASFNSHCSAFSVIYRLALRPMLKAIPQQQQQQQQQQYFPPQQQQQYFPPQQQQQQQYFLPQQQQQQY